MTVHETSFFCEVLSNTSCQLASPSTAGGRPRRQPSIGKAGGNKKDAEECDLVGAGGWGGGLVQGAEEAPGRGRLRGDDGGPGDKGAAERGRRETGRSEVFITGWGGEEKND